MSNAANDDLIQQLKVLRAQQRRWIADQDPTLTWLKQALVKVSTAGRSDQKRSDSV